MKKKYYTVRYVNGKIPLTKNILQKDFSNMGVHQIKSKFNFIQCFTYTEFSILCNKYHKTDQRKITKNTYE